MSKIVFILVLVAISLITISVIIFFYSQTPIVKNNSSSRKVDVELTTIATFTYSRFLRIREFEGKIYVLTDHNILNANGKVMFSFKATSPYDFVVSNGNYFVSDLPEDKIISSKGTIETDVWPSIMKIHNGKIYVATLRSNKLDVIDPKECKIVKILRTPPTPVDFLFLNGNTYILSSSVGAIFLGKKRTKLDFGVFSMFSDGKNIFVVSPKRIYKLDLNLNIIKFIETDYVINDAFFDGSLYVSDTFGYIRQFNSDLKEINFKKFTDYAISILKKGNDYYLSNVNGVYKNNNLILKSNFIEDVYDRNHILYQDGRVKIGNKIVKINGYPIRIIVSGYTYCFNRDGYIYMFDNKANLILKKYISGGINGVKLFDGRFYIITLNSIVVLDKVTLNPIVSKRISILPYKMKFYNNRIYILSIYSRTINEYSQNLSLVKEYPLQNTCYDFYIKDSKIHTDPNLLISKYLKKYNTLITYDGKFLYIKNENFFKKIKIYIDRIIFTDGIYLLTKDSLIRLKFIEK
jgi:DNA-binding beta-propeller fold protein YncE